MCTRGGQLQEARLLVRPDLVGYAATANQQLHLKVEQMRERGHSIYQLGFWQSPFAVPSCVQEALAAHTDKQHYLPTSGVIKLRQRLLELHRRLGHFEHFSVDCMLVGAGSLAFAAHLFNVFVGDVLLVSPYWLGYATMAVLARRPVHAIHTTHYTRFMLTPKLLLEYVAEHSVQRDGPYRLLLLNTPNNISGQCFDHYTLQLITSICRRYRILVLSDESCARLQYDNRFVSISKYYPEGTIVVSGLSKWASLGGWRIGYMLFPPELNALYYATALAARHSYTCAPAPVQHAVHDVLQDRHEQLDRYVRHTTSILAALARLAHRLPNLSRPIEHFRNKLLKRMNINSYCIVIFVSTCSETPIMLSTWSNAPVCSELTAAGCRVHASQAGYCLLVEFISLTHLYDDVDVLCNRILHETHVAVASCVGYGRQRNELLVRVALVDFDGTAALASLRSLPHQSVDQAFVHRHCLQTVLGIKALCKFVEAQLKIKAVMQKL